MAVSKKRKKSSKKKSGVPGNIYLGHKCPPREVMLEDISNNLVLTGKYRYSTFAMIDEKTTKEIQKLWVELTVDGIDVNV